jgi:hypothetical protein
MFSMSRSTKNFHSWKCATTVWRVIPLEMHWNKGQKVLKVWKFDEKRTITPKWVMGFTSKVDLDMHVHIFAI